jgi:hypothetical protein
MNNMITEIRTKLDENETMSEDIRPFEKMFLGNIVGVLLHKRGQNDPHVCFQIIHEDDGYWFLSTNYMSAAWLEDWLNVLQAVKEWCTKNCEPQGPNGAFGWKFK